MDTSCNNSSFTFPYDVILAHGPGCNDGATSAWCVWRTLPREYRDMLANEGGFYSKPEPEVKPESEVKSELEVKDEESEKEETTLQLRESYIHPNSSEGALRLQERGFPVVIVFVQPSEGVPDRLVRNKRVLILDLDMGDALIPVVTAAHYTLLSDHHDSTPLTINKHADFLLNQCRHKFGMYVNTSKSECGATLAWKLTHSADIPPFVQVVRIGDTWQWHEYPELQARFVLKALHIRRAFRSFPDIEATFLHWRENFQSCVQKGRALLEYETALVKQIAKQCDLGYIQVENGTVYTVAYTQANVLHSEVGSTMKWYAQQRFNIPIDFCATWKYVSYRKIVSVSLRDGSPDINLASVARTVKGCDGKGGGHAAAAGFTFPGLINFHNFILETHPGSGITTTTVPKLDD